MSSFKVLMLCPSLASMSRTLVLVSDISLLIFVVYSRCRVGSSIVSAFLDEDPYLAYLVFGFW